MNQQQQNENDMKLKKLIADLRPNVPFRDNFEFFIDACIFAYQGERYDFFKPLDDDTKQRLLSATEQYVACAFDFHDPFGAIFMSEAKNNSSQVFTPEHIAGLMQKLAKVGTNDNCVDTCCGSGRLLLAAARGGCKLVFGWDIDPLCAKMCTLNLLVNNAQGTIYHGNSITGDIFTEYHLARVNGISQLMTNNNEQQTE